MAPFQNVPGRRLRPTLPYPLRFRFRLRFGSDTRARSGKMGRRRALFPTSHDHHPFDSQEERQAGRERDSSRVPTPRAENVPLVGDRRGPQENEENARVRARARVEGGRRGRGEEGSPRGAAETWAAPCRPNGGVGMQNMARQKWCYNYPNPASVVTVHDSSGGGGGGGTAGQDGQGTHPDNRPRYTRLLLRLMRCSASMDGSIPGKRPRGQSGPVRLALPCPIPRSDRGLRWPPELCLRSSGPKQNVMSSPREDVQMPLPPKIPSPLSRAGRVPI
ncbi:hypothetical protein PCL_11085 [Purpureocillium lilacinum]|uniref:Uncharacterized protein n=1 Tax=Purpureocillium lilacinum TaxID=33203 RepID=A0A2U3EDA3_PURLI|nr:hypothetical protein PCL_11085 [Purpureocillium lilacinum]